MKKQIFLILLVCAMLLSACTSGETKTSEGKAETGKTISDSRGQDLHIDGTPKKVVALSSSWVDLWKISGGEVIGTTLDGKVNPSLNLDDNVSNVGTIKDPNLESILKLKPDLVILSKDIPSHVNIAKSLDEAKVNTYVVKIENMNEYLDTLKNFTRLTGKTENYKKYGTDIEKEVKTLLRDIPNKGEEKSALVLRAFSTGVKPKADGHVVCSILEDIGIKNIAKNKDFPLDDISMEAIMDKNPDFIFIVPMGDEDKAKDALKKSLSDDPAWNTLDAVKKGKVIILEKNLYNSKPNERWAEAYEKLLEITYPEQFKK